MLLRALTLAFLIMWPVMASGRPRAPVATTSSAAAAEPGLVGTWRLVRFETRLADGKVEYEYGPRPFGYFVYDMTGHLSVHIMRNPPMPPFVSRDADKATDHEKAQAFQGYVGYFGTYRVDKAKGILHHQVEGSNNPNYTKTDQARPYRLNGNVLIIEVQDPVDGTVRYRELHRVH